MTVERAGPDGGDVVPSLDVHGLAFAYPDGHQALFGVDLVVGRGERVALLGPNGAGKTTLVLHLNGILTAGIGTVRVDGLEVRPRDRETLREADESVLAIEEQYNAASGAAVNISRSQGWNRLNDSVHTELVWSRLRGA